MNDNVRRLLVARPRGFCAGVERAIAVVEAMLEQVEGDLYVRREIVHNQAVVEDFRRRGVIFVDELDEVPDGGTVVFSAHGVAPSVREEAAARGLRTIDATCPLVTKVHNQVAHNVERGRHILLIGHAGHDEVVGTLGVAPEAITLVTGLDDAATLDIPGDLDLFYVTQTTLSVDETRGIIEALRARFPRMRGPANSDICYATQNRQDAVKEMLDRGIARLLVVGSANSSNSRRLCEVARARGVPADLIDGVEGLPASVQAEAGPVGLTAGASAPEHLVQEIIVRLRDSGRVVEEVFVREENVKFSLPVETITKPN